MYGSVVSPASCSRVLGSHLVSGPAVVTEMFLAVTSCRWWVTTSQQRTICSFQLIICSLDDENALLNNPVVSDVSWGGFVRKRSRSVFRQCSVILRGTEESE
jgi:hypothetical protein